MTRARDALDRIECIRLYGFRCVQFPNAYAIHYSIHAARGGSGFIIDNRLCHTHVLGKRCAFVNNFPLCSI